MPDLEELLKYRTDHLAWPVPEGLVNRLGERDARIYLEGRKRRIERADQDPLRYGYVPPVWDLANAQIEELKKKRQEISGGKGVIKLIIFGGNRSSKTRFAANLLNRELKNNDGARWWACDSTEAQARANQMRLIWEQFPPEWKYLERDQVTDIRYSTSDGFPKNLFVAPNKSECFFKFYTVDLHTLPGPELSGAWADELIPLPWVHFLTYRLANRNGLLLVTFTPEFGWNETFGHFYEGSKAIEEQEAKLLPKYDKKGAIVGYKTLPRVAQCEDPLARIVFFSTFDNPFGNAESIVQEVRSKGNNEDDIKIRIYGVCTKSYKVVFPLFSKKSHVITQDQFDRILKLYPKHVNYHLVDPCDGRNWFMIWICCPSPDRWIIYREWPSHGHPDSYIKGVGDIGPWAVNGAAVDGARGPGQDTLGWGLENYREEIEEREKGEEIAARYIDSRYATASRIDREDVTTLQEQCEIAGMDFLCMVAESKILGTHDGSIDIIRSALAYDVQVEVGKYSATLSRMNNPQLQVVDTCPNVIYALEHWTGMDGQKGACKDPIDVIRGAFLTQLNWIDVNKMNTFVGGGIPR